MDRDFVITISRNANGDGYECRDNRTSAIGVDPSQQGALVEWVAEATKAGAFADNSTPLLRPPRLRWPTETRYYTQRFGMNPVLYAKYGLPGHEGVDMRAPHGSAIIAAASGIVSEVGWRKPGHPYGYAIRLRHSFNDGEDESIYAHMLEKSAKVNVGDSVKAGDLIGFADETGNVLPPDRRGAHLHFGLKKIGFKNGGYGELINPEPFFIDGPAK